MRLWLIGMLYVMGTTEGVMCIVASVVKLDGARQPSGTMAIALIALAYLVRQTEAPRP